MPIHVLHVAAECAPLAKVGGLADVVGALPRWSRRVPGQEASVLLPWYGLLGGAGASMLRRGSVVAGGRELAWATWRAVPGLVDFPLYLVESDVFREGGVYGPAPLERQAVLGAAASDLVMASRAGEVEMPRVDVLHAHDHHAAFAALGLRGRAAGVGIVTTVHNARYHGDHAWDAVTGLAWGGGSLVPDGGNFGDADHDGRFNSLKAAVMASHVVSTVSPTHARELATQPHSSNGLDYAFRAKADALVGILNGIDTQAWDPATDGHLPAGYSADDLAGKAACKAELCRMHGLDASQPLLAFVGRLVPEKGLDALLEAAPRIDGAQLLVLGSGDRRFEDWLRDLAARHPGRVAAALRHDEGLAHLVYAGADMLLMPSWHEPCGLSQMYALRYGTVPIVNPTGGLRDSIAPFDERSGAGTGFWMEAARADALLAAVHRALAVHRSGERWSALRDRGMRADLSWDASAARHAETHLRAMKEAAS